MTTTGSSWEEDAGMSDWHYESIYGTASVQARFRGVLAAAHQPPLPDVSTIDPARVPSAALRRIVAEVQQAHGRPARCAR